MQEELRNRQHERFCREYIRDHNGTKAAIRAGYAEHAAAQQASRLLKREDIFERVKALEVDLCASLGLTAGKVITDLMTVVERCMQAEPVKEWDYEAHEYRETGEYMFDSKGANKALELLGQHLGMFGKGQKVQVETEDKQIRVTLSDD